MIIDEYITLLPKTRAAHVYFLDDIVLGTLKIRQCTL